jgi:hypothetical protein
MTLLYSAIPEMKPPRLDGRGGLRLQIALPVRSRAEQSLTDGPLTSSRAK